MKRFFAYLRARPLAVASIAALLVMYLMMACAEFVAPYAPTRSFPEKIYHPPNLRLVAGRLQAQEWRIINLVSFEYVRVAGSFAPVRFLAEGEPYLMWGLFPATRRLFTTGAGEYPLFLMGADHLGRCLFSRIVHGSRISLTIGFVATLISLTLAVFFGGLAGYYGGLADSAIMRFSEFLMLIPGLYLILFLRSLMGAHMDTGQAYMMITLILSLVGWPMSARIVRGMVHSIKREEFVMNAQLEMIPSPVIIMRHIVPQIASLLIVSVALSIPGFIMTETVLSYLGLGITDPAVSWGSLIRRDVSTLANLRAFPWLLGPVWFLLGVTLAFNFLGDALRDYFDPYHAIFPRLFKRGKARAAGNGAAAAGAGAEGKGAGGRQPVDSASGALLEVRDLRVSFLVRRGRAFAEVPAVRGVSFSLGRGECLGIVGESGSGKTVGTMAIPGLLPGNARVSGSIAYGGRELAGLGTRELREYRGRKIGMIFQEPGRSFDPLQTIGGAFFETLRNSQPGIAKADALERAAALLAETGLERGRERLGNYPHQFSGGQLQRIGIALALAQGCSLLIADEPTTALDVTIQKQIIELLKALRESRGISIVFISHDIDLVAEISDSIIVMYGGLVMESGPPREITENARHPYTAALLASSPRFGSHHSRERLASIPGSSGDGPEGPSGCPFAPRCPQAGPKCPTETPALLAEGPRALRCFAGNGGRGNARG